MVPVAGHAANPGPCHGSACPCLGSVGLCSVHFSSLPQSLGKLKDNNTSLDSHMTGKCTHIHVTTTMRTAWLEQTILGMQ